MKGQVSTISQKDIANVCSSQFKKEDRSTTTCCSYIREANQPEMTPESVMSGIVHMLRLRLKFRGWIQTKVEERVVREVRKEQGRV